VELLLAIGLGVGLPSVAGVRAFLPLALAYYMTLPEGSFLFGDLPSGIVLAVLAVLAILEIVLDKVRAVERVFNYVMVPVRIVAGALVLALVSSAGGAFSEAAPWLIAGGLVAGAVAVLKVVLRPPAQATSSGVSTSFLSLIEDAVGIVGGLIGLFVPFLPVLLVAFLLFFYARIRKRRGRKFGGLRILGD